MLKKLKPKSEFSKNVLTLMTGTTIAQAIPIAISPILTRIYTPEDFGVFALYMSIVSVISVIATGRYEMAIMLPSKNIDAVNILALSLIICLSISMLLLIIIFVFNSEITYLLGNPKISQWLYLIPLSILLSGLYQSFNYWSNRQKEYKRLATSRVVQSLTTSSTNLSMGINSMGSAGLILGSIIGQIISTAFLSRAVFLRNKRYIKFITKNQILIMARVYIKFPTWNLFASVINMLRLNLIVIFLSKYFLSSTLGYYYFADKLLRTPSNILISAFADVYYQRLSLIKSNQEIYDLSLIYLTKMLKLLIIPYIILLITFKQVIPIVFGNNWLNLYIYLYILSVPVFFNIVIAHFSKILIIINRQEVSFYIHFYKIIGLCAIIIYLYIYKIFTVVAILILAINEILWLLIGVLVIKKTLKVSSRPTLIYFLAILSVVLEYYIYIALIK